MNRQLALWTLNLAVIGGLIAAACQPALAQRPAAPKLLPESTVATLRIVDTPLLIERFRETALGQIGRDEKVKPLVSQFYGSLQEAWKQIEEQVGLPLDQVLAIPQGEICVALTASSDEVEWPGIVFILDVKDRWPQVEKLLEKGEGALFNAGGSKITERLGDHEVSVYRGGGGREFCLLERDGTVVITLGKAMMRQVVDAWEGKVERTLADKDRYNAIMSKCGAAANDPPQVTWYVDPVEIFREATRGSVTATMLAILPTLGLEGIHGVGGSITYATGEFDEVQHFHVLLDSRRQGVLEGLALRSGDSTPEPWVPAECVTYSTIHWDLFRTYTVAAKIYNKIMGERALETEIRTRIDDRLGVDFIKEVIPELDGRATLVQWVEKPVRINSIATLVGVKLRNPERFQDTFDKILQRHKDRVEKQRFGNVAYWSIRVPQRTPPAAAPSLRQPQPCVGIVGEYLLMTDSLAAFQEAVLTTSDAGRGLAGSLEYKLVASQIKRQAGGAAPGMIQFQRPEEGLRFWYDLASSADTRRQLAERGESNFLFNSLNTILKDNELPPFAVMAQYLAPGGAMLVNDETGYHYTSFTLRR